MHWIYQGQPVENIDIKIYPAFVYVIKHNTQGWKYLGKKNTIMKKRGKMRESYWRNYWGSSKAFKDFVKQEGKENFTREIIRLCRSKVEATYYEAKYQMERDVLLKPDEYFNRLLKIYLNANTLGALR